MFALGHLVAERGNLKPAYVVLKEFPVVYGQQGLSVKTRRGLVLPEWKDGHLMGPATDG